jgi:hypothetical protein
MTSERAEPPKGRVEAAQLMGIDVAASTWAIAHAQFVALLSDLGVLPDDMDSMIAVLAVDSAGELPYEIRVGQWRLDLEAAAARALINSTVLTAALAADHQSSIPATVLSVAVPLLFDLEKVTLSPQDRYLYATLLNSPHASMTFEQWYQHLPARITDELTALELRDVLGRLEDAGAVDTDAAGITKVTIPSPRRLVRLALPAPPDASEYR